MVALWQWIGNAKIFIEKLDGFDGMFEGKIQRFWPLRWRRPNVYFNAVLCCGGFAVQFTHDPGEQIAAHARGGFECSHKKPIVSRLALDRLISENDNFRLGS